MCLRNVYLEKLRENREALLRKRDELENEVGDNPDFSKVMEAMLLSDICKLLESWENGMNHDLNITQISEIHSSLESKNQI